MPAAFARGPSLLRVLERSYRIVHSGGARSDSRQNPVRLKNIVVDDILDQKIAFSAELDVPLIGNLRGNFQFDAKSPQLNVEVRNFAVPLRNVHEFQSLVRKTVEQVAPGAGDCVSIAGIELVPRNAGQAQIRLNISDRSIDLPGTNLSLLGERIAQASGLSLANCLADRALQVAQAQLEEALRNLKGRSVTMFGMAMQVTDARTKPAGQGVRFALDLTIDTGTAKVRLNNVSMGANWSPGKPLGVADLDLSTVSLENSDEISAILNAAAPGLQKIGSGLKVERIAWRPSGPEITCAFTVPGLRDPIRVENLALDASHAQEAVRAALNAAATAFLTQ